MWFAFILVSLKYRKHLSISRNGNTCVVICFHFSIFEVSETSYSAVIRSLKKLWFAFISLSLKYRKHHAYTLRCTPQVVICFHFSIFEVSETSWGSYAQSLGQLWFAFILVSLKYRKHQNNIRRNISRGCDLLSF